MAVKTDVRMVKGKKDKNKLVKKSTYKCEGSYVDIDGKPHRYHKRGFDSSEAAKDWERVFLLKATNDKNIDMNFKNLFAIFWEKRIATLKNRTIDDTGRLIKKHILPYWKNTKVSNITMKQIEEYQLYLLSLRTPQNQPLANSYLKTIQTKFKTILRYGITMGYIKDLSLVTFKNIKNANEIKKEMLFWHPEEYSKFIKVVDDVRYLALFNVLYWCGLRIGEAQALTWNDIDLKHKSININKTYSKRTHEVTTPKTLNSYRNIIMPDICFKAVHDLYVNQSKVIGFNRNKIVFGFHKHLDDNSIRLKKNRYCEIAKVKIIRIHDFRHSHVSLLIDQGFNPFDIAKRLGHTVDMVNEVYGHWFDDAQQTMIDKLNQMSFK